MGLGHLIDNFIYNIMVVLEVIFNFSGNLHQIFITA